MAQRSLLRGRESSQIFTGIKSIEYSLSSHAAARTLLSRVRNNVSGRYVADCCGTSKVYIEKCKFISVGTLFLWRRFPAFPPLHTLMGWVGESCGGCGVPSGYDALFRVLLSLIRRRRRRWRAFPCTRHRVVRHVRDPDATVSSTRR